MEEKNKIPEKGMANVKEQVKAGAPKDAQKKRNKSTLLLDVEGKKVNIDMVISEIRKVMPLNRTKLKNIALAEFLKGKSAQDIARVAITYRKSSDIGELSNNKILE